jgi:hypothetical protein
MTSTTQLRNVGINPDHNDTTTYQLCSFCQNIIDQLSQFIELQVGNFEHCESYSALQESAKQGCVLCAQFCRIDAKEVMNSTSNEVELVEGKPARGNVRVFSHLNSASKALHRMLTLELIGQPGRSLRVDPAAIQGM